MKQVVREILALWENDPVLGFIATLGVVLLAGGFFWLLLSSWGRWWQRLLIYLGVAIVAFFLMLVGID